ncbi:hypothetical protein [Vibrio sp. RE88]|uniref:hypothetical protein n=1 Tax=Vibrio sp. RE88 TaxID=2607610 RepID=UPI0014935C95|nr:hypothetical protein [Vibrio sp. RE88]NOH61139.1 hypothetical protein [Vibrio sp. RE88]
MATKLMVRNDLVLGKHNGDFGIMIPDEFKGVDIHLLRLMDGKLINASENKQWFIDESSCKHIVDIGNCQPLECSINDQLLKEGNAWVVADILFWDKKEARKLRDELRNHVDKYTTPTATIDDIPVTSEQQSEAIAKSHELAAWPSQDNWPYISLPELPNWMPTPQQSIVWTFAN